MQRNRNETEANTIKCAILRTASPFLVHPQPILCIPFYLLTLCFVNSNEWIRFWLGFSFGTHFVMCRFLFMSVNFCLHLTPYGLCGKSALNESAHKSKAICFNKTTHIDPIQRHILKFNIFTFIAIVNICVGRCIKSVTNGIETKWNETKGNANKQKTDIVLFMAQMRQFLVTSFFIVSHLCVRQIRYNQKFQPIAEHWFFHCRNQCTNKPM